MKWSEVKDFARDTAIICTEIAKEKRKPMRVIKSMDWVDEIYRCPDCGTKLNNTRSTTCPECGRFLDWSEENGE